jgi:hypothetical protein
MLRFRRFLVIIMSLIFVTHSLSFRHSWVVKTIYAGYFDLAADLLRNNSVMPPVPVDWFAVCSRVANEEFFTNLIRFHCKGEQFLNFEISSTFEFCNTCCIDFFTKTLSVPANEATSELFVVRVYFRLKKLKMLVSSYSLIVSFVYSVNQLLLFLKSRFICECIKKG